MSRTQAPEAMTPPPSAPRFATRVRRLPRRAVVRSALLVLVVAAGALVALLVEVPSIESMRTWLADTGPAGWLALLAGLSLVSLIPIPRTASSLLAGVVGGFWGGLALALGSGVLGGLAGFGLARWLGRETVSRLAGPRLARADALLSRRGTLAVLSGRLVPVTPFTLVSYAAGLSGVRLAPYLLGTAVGLVPGTLLHVTIGATVGAEGSGSSSRLLLSLAPPVLAVVGLLALRWWRRRRSPRR